VCEHLGATSPTQAALRAQKLAEELQRTKRSARAAMALAAEAPVAVNLTRECVLKLGDAQQLVRVHHEARAAAAEGTGGAAGEALNAAELLQHAGAHAQALLSAGCDPHVESVRVVDVEGQFYQEGLDASSIATKRGNYCSDARNLAHYMFHTLNVEQRLLAAYRRLMLAAALEPHMGGTEQGSPLEWLEIELTTIAGCVGASTSWHVVDR
jgi:hypothetical protein